MTEEFLLRLILASFLGGIIGLERQGDAANLLI